MTKQQACRSVETFTTRNSETMIKLQYSGGLWLNYSTKQGFVRLSAGKSMHSNCSTINVTLTAAHPGPSSREPRSPIDIEDTELDRWPNMQDSWKVWLALPRGHQNNIHGNDLDLSNIRVLCDRFLALSEYRAQLYDYLKSRTSAIAPNLTVLVGKLIGAWLISHDGSLLNLAKQPGSTIQILDAEKALFRALKSEHATPKYGIIYHASSIVRQLQNTRKKFLVRLLQKSLLPSGVMPLVTVKVTPSVFRVNWSLKHGFRFLRVEN